MRVDDRVKENLIKIAEYLVNNPGVNTKQIARKIDKSVPSVNRYIKLLRDLGIIEHIGTPKAGGYHLTEKFKDRLK